MRGDDGVGAVSHAGPLSVRHGIPHHRMVIDDQDARPLWCHGGELARIVASQSRQPHGLPGESAAVSSASRWDNGHHCPATPLC
jgi:hypothetical protein